MHVILASDGPGVLDALQHAPWYVHLLAAVGLSLGAYGLHKFADWQEIDSNLLGIVQLFLAFGAFIAAMDGIFGNS